MHPDACTCIRMQAPAYVYKQIFKDILYIIVNKMKYECKICYYETNRKSNYDTHMDSKKHMKVVELVENDDSKIDCKYCKKIFFTKRNIKGHITC